MRPVGSTLTSPRSGEPDGPAAMNRPSSARRIWGISAVVPASLGTTSVAANRRIGATSALSVSESTACGIPARILQRSNEFAGLLFGGVDGGAFVVSVLGEAERLSKAGH